MRTPGMGYAQSASRRRRAAATAVAGLAVFGLAVFGLAVFGLAEPAAADVGMSPTTAEQTAGARLVFKVTNNSLTTSITRVQVRLPMEARITEAYPIAVPDWAPLSTLTAVDGDPSKEVATGITWMTMPGRDLKPGGTASLTLTVSPLPRTERLHIDVTQTNSDGTTETWAGVSVPAAGAQHPAFELTLTPSTGQRVDAHGNPVAGTAADDQAAVDQAADDEPTGGSNTGRTLLVLAIIALVTLLAFVWQRRSAAATEHAAAEADAAAKLDAAADAAAVKAVGKKRPGAANPVAANTGAGIEARRRVAARKTPAPRKVAVARRTTRRSVPADARTGNDG